jgi:hypothetical protein
MTISHAKQFVMFAPWKTASSRIHRRLEQYNESPYSRFFYFNPYLQRVVHQHVTCAEFTSFPESRCGYFLASFVRTPYDRVYSGFLQLQKDIQQEPYALFPERGELSRVAWRSLRRGPTCDVPMTNIRVRHNVAAAAKYEMPGNGFLSDPSPPVSTEVRASS